MLIMQYLQNLSNDFDLIKKFFEIEKNIDEYYYHNATFKAEQESQNAELIQQYN
jgi:hypothetical protein